MMDGIVTGQNGNPAKVPVISLVLFSFCTDIVLICPFSTSIVKISPEVILCDTVNFGVRP